MTEQATRTCNHTCPYPGCEPWGTVEPVGTPEPTDGAVGPSATAREGGTAPPVIADEASYARGCEDGARAALRQLRADARWERVRAAIQEVIAPVERERDSLARRLNVRCGELEETRAALRQVIDDRDRWQAEAESLTDQLGDMRAALSAVECRADELERTQDGRPATTTMADLTDWRGNDLDLAIERGGRVRMRCHASVITLEALCGVDPVTLTPAEAAEVVTSLVAAIVLAAEQLECPQGGNHG